MPILVGEIVENNQKYFFMLFWGIWAPPNGRKKIHKGLQVGGGFVTMSEL
jgi:hypothetical protein